MPRICLSMIVKNESALITECLDSVRPWISSFVVCDTGSTDNTVEQVENWGRAHNIPGLVESIDFGNFSQARNQALEKARQSPYDFDFMLLIDADMRLVSNSSTPRELDPAVDAYLLEQRSSGLDYWNLRLLHRKAQAEYQGSTHEALWVDGKTEHLHGAWMVDLACGANRPEKLGRDLTLLHQDLENDPQNARAAFYLAQTYKDSGDWSSALRYYRLRCRLHGWDQETWYATYMMGYCLLMLGRHQQAVQTLLQAYSLRPERTEPLYWLARHHREQGQYELAWLYVRNGLEKPCPAGQPLFLQRDIYRWGFREEASVLGYYLKDTRARDSGLEQCERLAVSPAIPMDVQQRARANLEYYKPVLSA